jgi:hypothetical protein
MPCITTPRALAWVSASSPAAQQKVCRFWHNPLTNITWHAAAGNYADIVSLKVTALPCFLALQGLLRSIGVSNFGIKQPDRPIESFRQSRNPQAVWSQVVGLLFTAGPFAQHRCEQLWHRAPGEARKHRQHHARSQPDRAAPVAAVAGACDTLQGQRHRARGVSATMLEHNEAILQSAACLVRAYCDAAAIAFT